MPRPFRASLALATLALLATAASGETKPASKPTTQRSLSHAIAQLDDRDFQMRERATHELWSAGDAAKPILQQALGDPSVSPESRRRSQKILANLAYGITPDMSDEIVQLMSKYRSGNAIVKRQAALALVQRGSSGATVLLKLADEEREPVMQLMVSTILLQSSRELAVSLIADGKMETAGKLLGRCAASGDERAALNYAAFLLVHGGLADAIARAQRTLDEPPAPGSDRSTNAAIVLAYLHRANGDLAAARIAAEQSASDALLTSILIEQCDWTELARCSAEAIGGGDAGQAGIEELSFAMTFHRLAGHAAGVEKYAAQIATNADRRPDASWHAAEGLLLNGRVDAGVDVLVRHGHLADAMEFHSQRFNFDGVTRTLERARTAGGNDLGVIEAKAARVAWFTGDTSGAIALLESSVKACEKRRDLPGIIAAAGVASEMGLDDRVHWYTIASLNIARAIPNAAMARHAGAPIRELFQRTRFRNPEMAAEWWQVLRRRAVRDPAAKLLEQLRAIDGKTMPLKDLLELCESVGDDALKRPPEWRQNQLQLVAETLADFGQRDAAVARYVQLVEGAEKPSPAVAVAALMKVAAFDADAGEWRVAADRYHRAWQLDRANPVPLYLSGWTLAKAGDASIGQQRMDRAHLIPLSDQDRRYQLQQALADRKLDDEASRERDLILRTSAFLSWRRSESLRQQAELAQAAGDLPRAVELWESAFLDNNSEATKFVDAWANVSMPVLIRRTRAQRLIRAGDVKAGLAEAHGCMAVLPGDADGLIELVTMLDATNHKAEADAFYKQHVALFGKLCQTYPQSGPLHNLYAWTAAKCRRELDAALSHAKRAVELQPTNTASIDTLAETHFQRGEFPAAIEAMQRCAKLEPGDPRHKEQLERFRKAAAAARPASP